MKTPLNTVCWAPVCCLCGDVIVIHCNSQQSLLQRAKGGKKTPQTIQTSWEQTSVTAEILLSVCRIKREQERANNSRTDVFSVCHTEDSSSCFTFRVMLLEENYQQWSAVIKRSTCSHSQGNTFFSLLQSNLDGRRACFTVKRYVSKLNTDVHVDRWCCRSARAHRCQVAHVDS